VRQVKAVEFKKLAVGPGGVEAGRSLFEQLVIDLVGVLHPTVRAVRAAPGDWGIDAYVGQLEPDGAVHIWQAKYFPDGLDKAQKGQIRDAYTQALKEARSRGHHIDSWTLCVPCSLSGPETAWWNRWKRSKKEDGVAIELWPEEKLRRLILAPEAGWVYDSYLSDDPADRPTRKLVDLKDQGRYDGALFVQQMLEADIKAKAALTEAKRAYFNAELVEADVLNRESESQKNALETVRMENYSIWSTKFVGTPAAKEEAAQTYASVFTELRAHHHASGPGALRLHFIHRNGVMHQLVDDGRAGWFGDYEQVISHHGG
jgi:hypothetical protein